MSIERFRDSESKNQFLTLEQEIAEILALAPQGKETKEARTNRNPLLRKRLAASSDSVVAYAAIKMGGLTERELISRLEQGRIMPLEPLLDIVCNLADDIISSRNYKKLPVVIGRSIPKNTLAATQDELVGVFCKFVDKRIARDTSLLEEALSWREDTDVIIQRVVVGIPQADPADNIKHLEWGEARKKEITSRMEDLKVRSIRIRNAR